MEFRLEMILNQVDGRWVGRSESFEVSASRLAELDAALQHEIDSSPAYPAGSQVEVRMACDRRIIPAWMRPYQSHYFNRVITIVAEDRSER